MKNVSSNSNEIKRNREFFLFNFGQKILTRVCIRVFLLLCVIKKKLNQSPNTWNSSYVPATLCVIVCSLLHFLFNLSCRIVKWLCLHVCWCIYKSHKIVLLQVIFTMLWNGYDYLFWHLKEKNVFRIARTSNFFFTFNNAILPLSFQAKQWQKNYRWKSQWGLVCVGCVCVCEYVCRV